MYIMCHFTFITSKAPQPNVVIIRQLPFFGDSTNLTCTVAFHTNVEIRDECNGPRAIAGDRFNASRNASHVSGSGSIYSVCLITDPLR